MQTPFDPKQFNERVHQSPLLKALLMMLDAEFDKPIEGLLCQDIIRKLHHLAIWPDGDTEETLNQLLQSMATWGVGKYFDGRFSRFVFLVNTDDLIAVGLYNHLVEVRRCHDEENSLVNHMLAPTRGIDWVEHTYQLRKSCCLTFTLPFDMPQFVIERLCHLVQSAAFLDVFEPQPSESNHVELLKYAFRLDSHLNIDIYLPSDLHALEAEKISEFLQSLERQALFDSESSYF
ncbi:hypothetical protein [Alteromonas gracilis]|uniref:hypothetical protein n=1 Tax=Alteromonas gracilis TaxID=1479524 RepID=UPI0030D536C7